MHWMAGVGGISDVTQGRPEAQLGLGRIHYCDEPVPSWLEMILQIELQQDVKVRVRPVRVRPVRVRSVRVRPVRVRPGAILNLELEG